MRSQKPPRLRTAAGGAAYKRQGVAALGATTQWRDARYGPNLTATRCPKAHSKPSNASNRPGTKTVYAGYSTGTGAHSPRRRRTKHCALDRTMSHGNGSFRVKRTVRPRTCSTNSWRTRAGRSCQKGCRYNRRSRSRGRRSMPPNGCTGSQRSWICRSSTLSSKPGGRDGPAPRRRRNGGRRDVRVQQGGLVGVRLPGEVRSRSPQPPPSRWDAPCAGSPRCTATAERGRRIVERGPSRACACGAL